MYDPYFPPLLRKIECDRCEKAGTCPSAFKDRRNWRELSFERGRCPRLPDEFGEVDAAEAELYSQTFPLVKVRHVGDKGNALRVELHLPGERKWRRLRWSEPDGYWYFVGQDAGRRLTHTVYLEHRYDRKTLVQMMRYSPDRQFRAEVPGLFCGAAEGCRGGK